MDKWLYYNRHTQLLPLTFDLSCAFKCKQLVWNLFCPPLPDHVSAYVRACVYVCVCACVPACVSVSNVCVYRCTGVCTAQVHKDWVIIVRWLCCGCAEEAKKQSWGWKLRRSIRTRMDRWPYSTCRSRAESTNWTSLTMNNQSQVEHRLMDGWVVQNGW